MKPDSERAQWTAEPYVGVGPLRFGMSPEQVSGALGGVVASLQERIPWGNTITAIDGYTGLGLRAYFADCARLAGVSVDALCGPQVRVAGMPVVGHAPSEVEQWIIERAERREPFTELFYMPAGDPGSQTLGLVACSQRAGDILLTRPVFLAAEWDDDAYHRLPSSEWSAF
ncbi:hypothetical protein [Kitasatospora sp. NPDC017646]|uniref:hypothetical protein n=1 Tax=Kitasatospora sp. NPDC017646 TaxID=3364024 RepID=UPI0037A24EA5